MGSGSASNRTGFGSVNEPRPSQQSTGDQIIIRDLNVAVLPSATRPSVQIDHLLVIVPELALRSLVASAASRAGVNATGTLSGDLISVAVSVSLLRLTATFSPSVADGRLILEPRGGLPGWLLGRAAPVVSRTAGLTMSPNGRITVDPTALAPPGVRFRRGFTGVQIDRSQLRFTFG